MKKVLLALLLILPSAFTSIADDDNNVVTEPTTTLIKETRIRKHLPGMIRIDCYYHEGELTLLPNFDYEALYVSIIHQESATSKIVVLFPQNPTFNIGTVAGTYKIEARTDGNQIFSGTLAIN